MNELLKQLTALNGPSGYEHQVTFFIENYVKDKVDTVKIDAVGNVIARKKGGKSGPVVLLTAHMDEVGFIVKKIEENGLLRFEKLGGHDDRILPAQQVKVLGSEKEIDGVIGTISAHFVKFDDPAKVRKYSNLYIDVGVTSIDEVRELGIEVGTPVTWATESKVIGCKGNEMMVGKSLDDRTGCAVLLQTLNEIQGKEFAGELIFLFTVQEEVGLRGAQTAINGLEADVAIAVDTTAVSDTPEETMDNSLQIGKGAGIKVMDASLIVQKTIKNLLINIAKEQRMNYQLEIFTGIGTDGGAVASANKGIPTGVLSIPSRNAHSPVELVNVNDVNKTKELLKSFILNINENTNFAF